MSNSNQLSKSITLPVRQQPSNRRGSSQVKPKTQVNKKQPVKKMRG
ncbi:MAG: hypothetical protein LBI95_01670 [Holosporales bacterium]|nr:hypothetical protein [Holosporales bacterium]